MCVRGVCVCVCVCVSVSVYVENKTDYTGLQYVIVKFPGRGGGLRGNIAVKVLHEIESLYKEQYLCHTTKTVLHELCISTSCCAEICCTCHLYVHAVFAWWGWQHGTAHACCSCCWPIRHVNILPALETPKYCRSSKYPEAELAKGYSHHQQKESRNTETDASHHPKKSIEEGGKEMNLV